MGKTIAGNTGKWYNMPRRKRYEDLTFTDDFLFCKIMRDKDICKKVLEIILGIKIRDIRYPEIQKTLEFQAEAKGIRMDVYVEDEENTVYNIEMQTSINDNLLKRSRYYQALMDLGMSERGMKYKSLKKSFIIFICTEPPFGSDLPLYTFRRTCMEEHIPDTDDTCWVFVNAKGCQDMLNPDQRAFWEYVHSHTVTNSFTKDLEDRVEKSRNNEDWRVDFMKFNLMLDEAEEAGRVEGRAEGTINTLITLASKGIISVETAAREAGMDTRQFQTLLESPDIIVVNP